MLFYFAARNAAGHFVRGSLESRDVSGAVAALRARSLFVSVLEESSTLRGFGWSLLNKRRKPAPALAAFFRAFATLLRAGVPMARALPACSNGCADKRLTEAIRALEVSVANGTSLSAAMTRQPDEFTPMIAASVRAGEHAGALDDVLDRLANALERDAAVSRKVVNAFIYPGVVMCVTLAVLVLLLTTTLPSFASTYVQLRIPMPAIMRVLLVIGNIFCKPISVAAVISALCLIAAGFSRLARKSRVALILEDLQLRIPVAGDIVRKIAIARISRLLAMLLECGVALHVSVPIVAGAVERPRFRGSLIRLGESLAEGSSIASTLAASDLYPAMFMQLIRIGEETGQISTMLGRAATYYEHDVENAIERLSVLIEPAMIVLLGGAVGLIAASVFIPLYTLIGSIK